MYRLTFTLLLLAAIAACSDQPADKDAAPSAATPARPKPPEDKLAPATVGDLKVQKFGQIYLGGQPSADDLAKFKQAGGKTVVNLRDEAENTKFNETSVLAGLGIDYHNPGFRNADALSDPIFRRVRDLLANGNNAPLLLHCASGNRVGAIWMAHRVLDHGVPYEQALEEAKAVGMKPEAFEAKVKQYIESKPE